MAGMCARSVMRDEGLDGLAARRELLDQRREGDVEEQHLVFGVVDDVVDLLGKQPRVDGVQHRAACPTRRSTAPGAGACSRPACRRGRPAATPSAASALATLLGPAAHAAPVRAVDRAFGQARDDLGVPGGRWPHARSATRSAAGGPASIPAWVCLRWLRECWVDRHRGRRRSSRQAGKPGLAGGKGRHGPESMPTRHARLNTPDFSCAGVAAPQAPSPTSPASRSAISPTPAAPPAAPSSSRAKARWPASTCAARRPARARPTCWRPANLVRTRARRDAGRRQRLGPGRGRRRGALAGGARHRLGRAARHACRSCRPPCCSTCRWATRASGPMRRPAMPPARRPRAEAPAEGNVGAGSGALVGKIFGIAPRDEGRHRHRLGHGRRRHGRRADRLQRAGRRDRPRHRRRSWPARAPTTAARCCDTRRALLRGELPQPLLAGTNTTIGVIATDAVLDQGAGQPAAPMVATTAWRAAINPVHTMSRRRHAVRAGHRPGAADRRRPA